MAHDTAAVYDDLTATGLQEAPQSVRRLDRAIVRGVTWTGGIKGVTQLLSWTCTIVLARILSPEDYGLVAMATVYLGLTTMITDFGLGTAIVALPELSEELAAQLHSAAVVIGSAAFVLSCIVAAPLARFFNAPGLTVVVIVLSSMLVIDSLRLVPMGQLARQLRFKELAVLDGVKALMAVAFALPLAVAGTGYWALVLGNVAAALILTVLVLARSRQPFAPPQLRALKSTLRFSWHILSGQLAWYGYTNADFVVAGRVLGKIALGEYTFAWTLICAPGDKIMAILGRAEDMVIANVQRDVEALRRYYLLFTEALSILIVPASVGLALVARDLVHLVFGAKWAAAVVPLQLLCVYTSIQILGTPNVSVLQVTGQAKFSSRCRFVMLAVLPLAFYFGGSRWGTVGLAAMWFAVYPILVMPMYARVLRTLRIRVRDYLASLGPTLLSAALMTAVVLTIRVLAPAQWPLAVRFGLQVTCGALAFCSAALFLQRQRLGALADLLRTIRSGETRVV